MSFRKQRPLVTTMHRVLNSTNAPHDSLSLDIVAHSFPLEVIVARTILWESLGAMPVSKIAEVSLLPLADVKKAVYALETAGLVKIYRDFPDELGDVVRVLPFASHEKIKKLYPPAASWLARGCDDSTFAGVRRPRTERQLRQALRRRTKCKNKEDCQTEPDTPAGDQKRPKRSRVSQQQESLSASPSPVSEPEQVTSP